MPPHQNTAAGSHTHQRPCVPALPRGSRLLAKCAFSLAREPVFSQPHTNGFCGIEKSTPQPAGPCDPLRPGRWVCERGGCKLLRGGRRAPQGLGASPRQPSQVVYRSISNIAAFAWCPTVCRGTDDCGEHHPSTLAGRWRFGARPLRRHLGRPRMA